MFTISSNGNKNTMIYCNKEMSDSTLVPILNHIGIDVSKQKVVTVDPVTYMICNSEGFNVYIENGD
jgi:hypothetical protein